MIHPKAALAARLLPLIDLTSLNDARDDDIAVAAVLEEAEAAMPAGPA